MMLKKNNTKQEVKLFIAMLTFLIIIIVSSTIITPNVTNVLSYSDAVQIIEVVTDNNSLFINSDGKINDYIIIRNTGNDDINLTGWGISDRIYEIRYNFSNCILQAGEDLCVFFRGEEERRLDTNEIYTDFGLASSGEKVVLFDPNGEVYQVVDVPPLGKDEVYCMSNGTWSISSESYVVSDTAYAGSFHSGIYINEVMTSNISYNLDGISSEADIIEIYNGTEHSIDLSNYCMSDSLDQLERFSFEKNSVIAPGEYIIVLCTPKRNTGFGVYYNSDFSINSSGESLYLYSKASNRIEDAIEIPELETDCSYARIGDTWSVQISPTAGFSNDERGIAALDEALRLENPTGIYISEVCSSNLSIDLPHVEGHYDYIELYNAGSEEKDLTGFTLSNNPKQPRKWYLNGLSISPGEYLSIY